jgi:hypothetical protein
MKQTGTKILINLNNKAQGERAGVLEGNNKKVRRLTEGRGQAVWF